MKHGATWIMWAASLSLLAFALLLAGCGGGNSPSLTAGDEGTRAKPPPSTPSKIAFDKTSANKLQVFTMFTNGSMVTQLTTNKKGENWAPSWNAAGTQICFVSNRDGRSRIYAMNADGTNQRLLTQLDRTELAPDWSPVQGSSEIVFSRGFDATTHGVSDLWIVDAVSGTETQLTGPDSGPTSGPDDKTPSWSPNGAFIVFRRDGPGQTGSLFVISRDGGIPWSLDINGLYPDWSPTGNKIAYSGNGIWYLEVDPATGNKKAGATPVQVVAPDPAFPNGYYHPTWSPDEQYIVFSASDANGIRYMLKVAASGGEKGNLGNGWYPDWGPVLQ